MNTHLYFFTAVNTVFCEPYITKAPTVGPSHSCPLRPNQPQSMHLQGGQLMEHLLHYHMSHLTLSLFSFLLLYILHIQTRCTSVCSSTFSCYYFMLFLKHTHIHTEVYGLWPQCPFAVGRWRQGQQGQLRVGGGQSQSGSSVGSSSVTFTLFCFPTEDCVWKTKTYSLHPLTILTQLLVSTLMMSSNPCDKTLVLSKPVVGCDKCPS